MRSLSLSILLSLAVLSSSCAPAAPSPAKPGK
jgi:hypothetical protein